MQPEQIVKEIDILQKEKAWLQADIEVEVKLKAIVDRKNAR